MKTTISQLFLKELESEAAASRKCLERIPANVYNWKPHEKSMQMGYLASLVADIPKWIAATLEQGEINLATWTKFTEADMPRLVEMFDANMAAAINALQNISDEALEQGMFTLKVGDQVVMQSLKIDTIGGHINHLVHHRGELVVYMRLNEILVPSIYGPSADEKNF
jgi:uncharacterized damage-inducible protein DinB